MRISGQGNHYSTMAVCALGIDSFFKVSIANYKNSFTACIQIQLEPNGVAPPPTRRSAASLLVDVSSPSLVPGRHVPLGRTGPVIVSVKALGGAVHGISLGKGLVVSSGGAVVVSGPAGLGGFTLARGVSRQFVFDVKTVRPGLVTLSARAVGRASSGGAVQGSGDLTAIVVPGFVVNTVSDAPIHPESAHEVPSRMRDRCHRGEALVQFACRDPAREQPRRERASTSTFRALGCRGSRPPRRYRRSPRASRSTAPAR